MTSPKLQLSRPTLIMLYGFPGAGKTYLARQLCDDIQAAHLQGDRIRYELFEEPRHDPQEDQIVDHLLEYMTEEFLSAGISVVYDVNASRATQRRELRDLARKHKANTLLIWLQIDAESAYVRGNKRDRRKQDDKYTGATDKTTFERLASRMQNPTTTEDYAVISGKHSYQTQRSAILKKLYDHALISSESAGNKLVMPGMVNLVPNNVAGRVDNSRRNIVIR